MSRFVAVTATVVALSGLSALLVRSFVASSPPRRSAAGWQVIRPPHEVSALAVREDVVWAGGRDGVWGIDRATGAVRISLQADVPLRYVRALLVDPSGALWIGHDLGLTRYAQGACRTFSHRDGLPDDRVNALCLDRRQRLWVGTWAGAAVREGDAWRVMTTADGLADDMVNVILADREGGMWLGSYDAPRGGLTHLAGGVAERYTPAEGLPHSNVTSVLQDRDGRVWVGTGLLDRGGAAQFGLSAVGWTLQRVLTDRDGLAGRKVRSLFQDRSGALWFGSEYDGLAVLRDGRFRVLTTSDGLSNNEVKAMLQDASGDLWLATRDGITRLQAAAWRTLTAAAPHRDTSG